MAELLPKCSLVNRLETAMSVSRQAALAFMAAFGNRAARRRLAANVHRLAATASIRAKFSRKCHLFGLFLDCQI